MGQPRPLFCLFPVFSNKRYIFTTIICEKCPSSIRCRDSNPRPLECESLPITTRPGLPPLNPKVCIWGHLLWIELTWSSRWWGWWPSWSSTCSAWWCSRWPRRPSSFRRPKSPPLRCGQPRTEKQKKQTIRLIVSFSQYNVYNPIFEALVPVSSQTSHIPLASLTTFGKSVFKHRPLPIRN